MNHLLGIPAIAFLLASFFWGAFGAVLAFLIALGITGLASGSVALFRLVRAK